jgi:hypothetical protein
MRFPTPCQTNKEFMEFRGILDSEMGFCRCDAQKAPSYAKTRHMSHYASESADPFDLWTILRN